MSGPWIMTNIGAALLGRAGGSETVVAGGGTDGTEVDGQILDMEALGWPRSCKLVINGEITLAEDKTLTIVADVDDSIDSGMSGGTQFDTGIASVVVATGDTGGSTEYFNAEVDINLSGVKRYFRAQFTPTMSAVATDAGEVCATWIFGGFSELSASEEA